MFATSCSPGPNNVVASYSGFNFGIIKTIPHMLGDFWVHNISLVHEFWFNKYFSKFSHHSRNIKVHRFIFSIIFSL